MKYCDLELPSPAENLACDEALLEQAEQGVGGELLRCWEAREYFVVVGYANKAAVEVNLEYCEGHGVRVFRRCTGGGTVLQGPGVLNYSLILRTDGTGPFQSISAANQFIMERHRAALAGLLQAPVEWTG